MIYKIRVWDEAVYEVEAETRDFAEELAQDYFDERNHRIEILSIQEED